MPYRPVWLAVVLLLGAAAGCQSGRYSTEGFSLAADGNPERGRNAFIALECYQCHDVAGVNLPKPAVPQPTMVVLGGEVDKRLSDAYLTTSMINPSHALAPYPKDRITAGGVSRMPSYADRMTARQITDVVAFLQANYRLRNPGPGYAY